MCRVPSPPFPRFLYIQSGSAPFLVRSLRSWVAFVRGLFKSECACSWKALRGRHYTGLRCHHCGTYSCVFIIFKVVVQYKFIFYVDIRVAKSRFLFDGRLYERFSVTALAFTKKSRTSRSLIISCFQMLRLVSQPVFFYFFFFCHEKCWARISCLPVSLHKYTVAGKKFYCGI